MYDVKALQEAFIGLVGVRQSNIPLIPYIESPLSDSSTGIYVDDKNPLAATENMYYSSPNFNPSSYPEWVQNRDYRKGIPVNYHAILYIALNDIIDSQFNPSVDSDNWATYNPFQSWLEKKYNQAVSNMMAEVVRRKKLQHMGRAIIERQQLYRGGGSATDKIIGQDRFVGFAINPQQAEGLWVYIDEIGIQLTKSQPFLTFYLYHSDSESAIGSWEIPIENDNTFSWSKLLEGSPLPWVSDFGYSIGDKVVFSEKYFKCIHAVISVDNPVQDPGNWLSIPKPDYDCIMKYLKQNTSGTYYFGYYEEDLIGNALSKSWNCNSAPCVGCNGTDLTFYNIWSKWTTFRNISTKAINEDRTLFDLNKISYDSITNWGMNFSMTVRCNLTDFIIYSMYQFSDVFAMQLCKEWLEAIANGVRIGPTPAQTKLSAIAALDPKSPGNWISTYNQAIDALNLDMSNFSSACMPCEDRKNKMKWFSM